MTNISSDNSFDTVGFTRRSAVFKQALAAVVMALDPNAAENFKESDGDDQQVLILVASILSNADQNIKALNSKGITLSVRPFHGNQDKAVLASDDKELDLIAPQAMKNMGLVITIPDDISRDKLLKTFNVMFQLEDIGLQKKDFIPVGKIEMDVVSPAAKKVQARQFVIPLSVLMPEKEKSAERHAR